MYKVVREFFYNEQGQLNIFGKVLEIALLGLIAFICVKFIKRIIKKLLLNKKWQFLPVKDRKKAYTLASLLESVTKAFLTFVWIMMSLSIMGINTSALLATAGMGGLAIGFGAQTLVKDFIGGFFIIFEGQYEIGDYVNLSGKDGVVENIALRTTTIKDFSGEKHIIPNGEIRIVTNRSKNDQRALAEFSISYETDVDNAMNVLKRAFEENLRHNDDILEGPTVLGISGLGASSVHLLVTARTKPQAQWAIEREMRIIGKKALDNANIEIPYDKLEINITGVHE